MNRYWNKDNFEGLLEIAQAIKAETYLADYRKYLVLREKGLRKQALDAVRLFVTQMNAADFEVQKKFTGWLLYTEWANGKVHQLIPHPLFEDMIKPCLQTWKIKEKDNPIPYRWAGIYLGEQTSLEKACAIDGDEQIARYSLIAQAIASIEYDTHHLPDYYIGDPKDALDIGARTKIRIGKIKSIRDRQRFGKDLDCALQLVKDWVAYNKSGAKDFAKWCQNLGRNYQWIKAYYYDA